MNDIAQRLSQLLDGREGFTAAVLFDCGEAGVVLIDGSSGAIKVSTTRGDTACTIAMSAETFRSILDGELDESAAFMAGEMRITGEIGLATQVSEFMRGAGLDALGEDGAAA